jgi:hypothetical protein
MTLIDENDAHPPTWPEHPPEIRELPSEEEFADLVRRLIHVLPDGPLLDHEKVFGKPSEN